MAKGEPYHELDVFKETGVSVPKARQREALEASANYLKEQILSFTGEGKTSVQGGKWKRKLEPEYAKRKKEESSVGFANLELNGDMLDALDVKPKGGKLVIEVGGDQAAKAEGNLLGSYGRDENPANAREFMPHKRGQHFRKEIVNGLREILQEYADGEEDQGAED